jgi:hypothetical protein
MGPISEGPGGGRIVIDQARPTLPQHARNDAVTVHREPLSHGQLARTDRAPERKDSCRPVSLVPDERTVGVDEHARCLLTDLREHLRRRRLPGHKRRHAPQGGLVLREPLRSSVPLGVRDRGGHQLGELDETGLGVPRQWFLICCKDDESPPEPPFHEDRRADAGANSARAHGVTDRAARRRVVDPFRLPGSEHASREILASQPMARPDGEGLLPHTRARHHHRDAVVLVSHHPDLFGAEQSSDFVGDRAEDLVRGCVPRNQRPHAAQRCLLVGEPRLAVPQRLLDARSRVDVRKGHDRTAAVRHLERRRDIRDAEHRAVATEEPVEVTRHRLARRPRAQHPALGSSEGTAVGMVVVDRLVAVATEQLPGVGIPERSDRRPVGEPDQPRCIHHPDRLFHSLQRGDKDIRRNRLSAILLQRLGWHPRAGSTMGWVNDPSLRTRSSPSTEGRQHLGAPENRRADS